MLAPARTRKGDSDFSKDNPCVRTQARIRTVDVGVYICMHIYEWTWMHTKAHANMCMAVDTYVSIHMCECVPHASIHHIRTYMHCVHIIHMYVCIYRCTSVRKNLSVDTHARASTHAHARTWILHMHSYICICTSRRQGTHSFFRLGQSTTAGSAASSVLDASLKPDNLNISLSSHTHACTHAHVEVYTSTERDRYDRHPSDIQQDEYMYIYTYLSLSL
jgi:hypothetical protein